MREFQTDPLEMQNDEAFGAHWLTSFRSTFIFLTILSVPDQESRGERRGSIDGDPNALYRPRSRHFQETSLCIFKAITYSHAMAPTSCDFSLTRNSTAVSSDPCLLLFHLQAYVLNSP